MFQTFFICEKNTRFKDFFGYLSHLNNGFNVSNISAFVGKYSFLMFFKIFGLNTWNDYDCFTTGKLVLFDTDRIYVNM